PEQLPETVRESREVVPGHCRPDAGIDAHEQHSDAGRDPIAKPQRTPVRRRPTCAQLSVAHTELRRAGPLTPRTPLRSAPSPRRRPAPPRAEPCAPAETTRTPSRP